MEPLLPIFMALTLFVLFFYGRAISRMLSKPDPMPELLEEKNIRLHARFDTIESQLKEIRDHVKDVNIRITILETRMEERSPILALPEKRKRGRPPKSITQQ